MLGALSVVMMSGGLVLMTGGSAQAAQDIHKSYVCKYTNTPGGGSELSQRGQNPIWVDNSSIAGKDVPVSVGDRFGDGQGYSVVIVANTEKLTPEPPVSACPAPENPPAKTSVTPSYPSATDPSCQTAGRLVVPSQPAGVLVTGGGQDGAGPGTYTFEYAPDSTHVFPAGTDTSRTVTVLPQLSGDACPRAATSVTPAYPSATSPSCAAAGALVVPSQPAGVSVSGGAANGSGPGTYTFTYAPASASYVFPAGTDTTRTVTVLPQKAGADCPGEVEQPTLVTPNAPSQTEPTCTTAGSITAPAAQTGVVVTSTDLGNGATRFVSVPAAGYTFGAGNAQTVSQTVTAKPRQSGSACGEVQGVDEGVDDPSTPVTPSTPEPEVEGTSAGRTPAVKGTHVSRTPVVKGTTAVRGTSAAVPNAVDAGLAGAPLTDVRVLVGQALLGGGLLLLAGAAWSGLGLRRRGDVPA
ncbi:MAG TPA: hypothetical protein VFP51_06220 [Nocardioidaceae bacterium]|nr:hypothetical protein [Nocardioidaceae bacterium]